MRLLASSKPLALDIFMIRCAGSGWCPFTGWDGFAHGAIEDGARRDKAVFWRLLLVAYALAAVRDGG